jgi:hypothetical protein
MLKLAARPIKDGGEMLAMSVICWFTYTQATRAPTQK